MMRKSACVLYSMMMMMLLLLLLQYHHVVAAAAASSSTSDNTTVATTQYMNREIQKLALYQFKLGFSINISTQSCDKYYYNDSSPWDPKMMEWSMNSDYCKWEGVTCNYTTGDVIGLNLSCSHLVGSIKPNSTLFQLSSLRVIDFEYIEISGVIPEAIFHLPNLKELHLFPEYSTNNLSISLPKLKWGSNSTLQMLVLDGITISGRVIPEDIFHLPNLKYLYIYVFPSSTNNVSVSLPKLKWGSSSTLQELDLWDIPIIEGVIPDSVGYLSSLTYLFLEGTNLSGPIPNSISNLTQLTNLYLAGNHLSGQIPHSLANLKKLEVLDLGINNLNGEFPSWVSILSQLQTLRLTGNSLTGSLPSYLPPLSLTQLTGFYLSNNYLNGTIPSWLFHLPSLKYLFISDNEFTGQLPYQFDSSRSSLQYFDCSNNSLDGTVPNLFYEPVNLRCLTLHSNRFHGSLSSSICNSTSLEILDLSHNNLSDVLPVCPGKLNYSLSVLDLRMNNISGNLPSALSNFHNLRTLNLNGNKLQGTIPPSFPEFGLLQVLDLGSNYINDTFPHCLEGLPKLQVLILKSNKFHGIIHNISKIEQPFPSLTILDISQNEFSGPLPAKYIKNFQGMMNEEINWVERNYMGNGYYDDSIALVIKGVEIEFEKILTVYTTIDLSRNNFNGEIPTYIGNLVSLRDLNLSHNHLTGSIPSNIGDLLVLESLDLSSNQLVGEIPQQLTHIDTLAKLNLSQNDLDGRIPEAPHFSTFDNDSYSENPGLCGRPLSKNCSGDIIESYPEEEDEDGDHFFSGFTWEAVVIGYGCGVVVGFVGGYVMFMVGKPKWYIGIMPENWTSKLIEIVRMNGTFQMV